MFAKKQNLIKIISIINRSVNNLIKNTGDQKHNFREKMHFFQMWKMTRCNNCIRPIKEQVQNAWIIYQFEIRRELTVPIYRAFCSYFCPNFFKLKLEMKMFNLFNGVHFPTFPKRGIKDREFIFGVSFYFLKNLFHTNNKTIILCFSNPTSTPEKNKLKYLCRRLIKSNTCQCCLTLTHLKK